MRLVLIGVIYLSLSLIGSAQTTWYVPDQFPKINQAIADASVVNGDTILVRPGTYLENVDFVGKAITLQSEHGPALTVIDGNQTGSVVIFQSHEDLDSILDGFTLTNGSGTFIPQASHYCGGGIYCDGASPTIRNNTIRQNSAFTGGGGGICCAGASSAHINGNRIEDNETTGYFFSDGGGILCSGSSPVIENNSIANNYAFFDGGGIACRYSFAALIKNNQLEGNRSDGEGGGIFCSASQDIITQNTIVANFALELGGGIAISWDAVSLISANRILDNDTGGDGGGIACTYTSTDPKINNNQVSGNRAAQNGGGIFCRSFCNARIHNNTITSNLAKTGGGIYSDFDSTPKVVNTILWDNHASAGPEIGVGYPGLASSLSIRFCNVKGGESAVLVYPLSSMTWGEGMIDEDPLFVDPEEHDIHLSWLSPCINRGVRVQMLANDLDGDARPYMRTMDIGADEFVGVHSLGADRFTVSINGGTVTYALETSPANGGRQYLMLGSMSGSSPGVQLPAAGKTLPIQWDGFTDYLLLRLNSPVFMGFLGQVDASGTATAQLNTPTLHANKIGKVMTLAFCLDGTPDWDFVSNPVQVKFVP